MKILTSETLNDLPGKRILPGQSFHFACRPGLPCYTRCCRNLNLFLYPYDVAMLRKSLSISSDAFLEQYVDMVIREGNFFPDVLLRMNDDAEKNCPFLTEKGCRVYANRPDTCRVFPMEQGIAYDENGNPLRFYLFKPPEFCLGPEQENPLTPESYLKEQEALTHNRMTEEFAKLKTLFSEDPWGNEGPYGQKGKMAFMAVYNIDRFREFVFGSSFLHRFRVKPALLSKLKKNDRKLLEFSYEWVRFFVFGIRPTGFSPR